MDELKVNLSIENLDELKKLLSTANELSQQLEDTIEKINAVKLKIKAQAGGKHSH